MCVSRCFAPVARSVISNSFHLRQVQQPRAILRGVRAISRQSLSEASAASDMSSAAPSSSDDVSGPLLQPSVFNTPWVRTAATAAAIAVAAGSSALLPIKLAAFAHTSCWAVFVGANLFNTFFVGLTLFKNLPRQTFGRVQSKLFPRYFALTAATSAVTLITLPMLSGPTSPTTQAVLGAALACSIANWLIVGPICNDILLERYGLENKQDKSDADKERVAVLFKKFGAFHGISSVLNLVAFCCGLSHGWIISSPLVA